MRFSEGEQVHHAVFGSGLVTSCDPMDADRLVVRFDTVGTRKMRGAALRSFTAKVSAQKPSKPMPDQPPGNARKLTIVTADAFAGKVVPPREWHVDNLIPAKTVTILNGDGGTGKSLLATQLAVATVSGSSWIGLAAARGTVLYLSAEDDLEELHRRVATISERSNLDLEGLRQLSIVPLAGEDALLAAPEGRGNILRASPLFALMDAHIARTKPTLVVLDTLADLFGGDENQRAQARQFVSLLRRWAIKYQTTILLLAHPSLSGMTNGSGSSGNTAWNNSVRSRLYLERVIARDKDLAFESDPDARVLRTVKANYGRVGGETALRWVDGVLQPSSRPLGGLGEQALAEKRADKVFLTLLAQFDVEGRHVSATQSAPTYAPAAFAKHGKSEGITKRGFESAMNRLFEASRIRVGKSAGPPSRQRDIIIRVIAGQHG